MTMPDNPETHGFYLNTCAKMSLYDAPKETFNAFDSICQWMSHHRTDALLPKNVPLKSIDPSIEKDQFKQLVERHLITDAGDMWKVNFYSKTPPVEPPVPYPNLRSGITSEGWRLALLLAPGLFGMFSLACEWAVAHQGKPVIPKDTPLDEIDFLHTGGMTRETFDALVEAGYVEDAGDVWKLRYCTVKQAINE